MSREVQELCNLNISFVFNALMGNKPLFFPFRDMFTHECDTNTYATCKKVDSKLFCVSQIGIMQLSQSKALCFTLTTFNEYFPYSIQAQFLITEH